MNNFESASAVLKFVVQLTCWCFEYIYCSCI